MICSLPPDIVSHIYSYDGTYRDQFDMVVFELSFLPYIRLLKKRFRASLLKIEPRSRRVYFRGQYHQVFCVIVEKRDSPDFRDTLRQGFLKNIKKIPDSFLGRYAGLPDFAVQCWKNHLSENELFEIFTPDNDIEYLLDMWLEEEWNDYTVLDGLYYDAFYFSPYWFFVNLE